MKFEPERREGTSLSDGTAAKDVRVIAFYLPQFHPIPENDAWWGKGFTEWRNVAKATALFPGHYQPRTPADFGFYDLRIPDVREAQAALAQQYGVHGFCYYFYWFNGRQILERPLREMLETGKPDFPFCICWANENWSRMWDGGNRETLLVQEHSLDSDIKFIQDVIPILKDPRYIRIAGKPLLLLYRADLLKDPVATAAAWREECDKAGLGGIHLCVVQSFTATDPREIGFDSACEFPPHQYKLGDITSTIDGIEPGFQGKIYDYEEVARHSIARVTNGYTLFRGIFPGWDNSPRKRKHALVFHNASPKNYEFWLRGLVEQTRSSVPKEQRIIFLNAWNEWAEGAYIEPDLQFGRDYLEATLRALEGRTRWTELTKLIRLRIEQAGDPSKDEQLARYLEELERYLSDQDRSLSYYADESRISAQHRELRSAAIFSSISTADLLGTEAKNGLRGWIDSANGRPLTKDMALDSQVAVHIRGWMAADSIIPDGATTSRYLLLRKADTEVVHAAPIAGGMDRPDVRKSLPNMPTQSFQACGFSQLFSLHKLPAGLYTAGVAAKSGDRGCTAWLPFSIRIVD